jgi:ABC-type transport system involved in multi-copper enzyme maturation permease subunit
VKDLGFATIMLCAAAFGVLNASLSISEEIEGRTAITLMSKPVSRRQFLIGKFLGILLASLAMTGLLSWVFDGILVFKLWYDRESIPFPPGLEALTPQWATAVGETAAYFLRGAGWWLGHAVGVLPGVILGFCHAMVLLAIAVALATRLPMIVNVVSCAVVFFLGNLTPVLGQVSQGRYALVRFMAQLFEHLLPGLDFFNMSAAIARDAPVLTGDFALYIGSVVLYAVLYTAIALLLGLILFEDRDLA